MMMLTCTASISLAAVIFIGYELITARDTARENLTTLARVIASSATDEMSSRAHNDAATILATLRSEPRVLAAALYDGEGQLIATYPRDLDQAFLPTSVSSQPFTFEGSLLQGFQPVTEDGVTLGHLFLRADIGSIYERFGMYGAIAAVIALLALLVAYVLSHHFQQRLSKPILALAETARAVSERRDLTVRAPDTVIPELDVLTRTFNRMLERIGEQNSALLENEARLRAVLDSALNAVIVMNDSGHVIDWNSTAERIFGWTREEALGRDLGELIIPERHRGSHHRFIARYISGEVEAGDGIAGRPIELTALRRDGSEFPAEVSLSVLRGDETTLCGFATDITERKESRARTQAHLARLDLLQRTTRAIAERQDLQSIYQVILRSLEKDLPVDLGCICEFDREAQRLRVRNIAGPLHRRVELQVDQEIPVDDFTVARSVSGTLVYEPDVSTLSLPLARTLAAGGVRALVVAPLCVENTVFGVLLVGRRAAHAFSSGDCEFLRQLSEHVALAAHQVQLNMQLQRAYDDLRQSQQIITQQERLRALGQMASGVAHDINNAISPIALYTEVLLEHEAGLSTRAREYLGIIQRSIEDVAQTVAKMREFYRQRDPAADLQPIELNPLVEQILKSSRARWADIPQERGVFIDARADIDPDLPRIMGSQSDIRDALTNLIFNAVDAMPNGGTLIVRTHTHVDETTGMHVDLEVSDSGIGMDEETRRRCLEPFFTTKGERGTGMGLAMVYGMARRHGASIDIDSAAGAGTTIRVRFRTAPQQPVQQVIAPLEQPVAPLRILIVDDDPLVLEAVGHVLSSDGHTTVSADGGQAGIDCFNAAHTSGEPFDLVMTDLGMPFIDGRAVAAAVKRLSPQTPVLLLTGWGERLQTEQTIPENVDRVLSKPPRTNELRRALAELPQRSVASEVEPVLEVRS